MFTQPRYTKKGGVIWKGLEQKVAKQLPLRSRSDKVASNLVGLSLVPYLGTHILCFVFLDQFCDFFY